MCRLYTVSRKRCVSDLPLPALLALALTLVVPVTASGEYDCGPEDIIGGVDEHNDYGVSIDVDSSGRAWVVWSGHDPVDYDSEIMFCVFEDGVWSEPDTLHGHNASSDRFPVISIGEDDVPWVVWYRAQENGERLWYSHRTDGSWSTPSILRTDAGRYDDYDICAVSSDDVWVATDTYVSGKSLRVLLIYHWDGSAWSEPWQLSMPEHSCCFPDFGLDPGGLPWVTWTGVPSEPVVEPVMYSRWTGTAWTEPDTVNADPNNSVQSQIVFDGDVPMVLWNGNSAGTVDVEYSRLEGGSWTPSALVNLPDSTSDDHDNLGACEVAPSGEIAAVWCNLDESQVYSPDIYVSWWTGSSWTPERELSADLPRKIDEYGDLAMTDDGTLWSAWVCYEEIAWPWDTDIRTASCQLATCVEYSLGSLEAEPLGSGVCLSWFASGEARDGPFYVWRAETSDLESLPSGPSSDAVQLNTEPIVSGQREWMDEDVPATPFILYWVEWRGEVGSVFTGPTAVAADGAISVASAKLISTAPNPTRTGASFHVCQYSPGRVEIALYTVGGREVRRLLPSNQSPLRRYPADLDLDWDGTDSAGQRVASGVYVARLLVDGRSIDGQKGSVTLLR